MTTLLTRACRDSGDGTVTVEMRALLRWDFASNTIASTL